MTRTLVIAICVVAAAIQPSAQSPSGLGVHEATITQIHAALQAKQITCRSLVKQYLRRIDVFDKNGPALNAIVITNPEALKQAGDLDRRFAQGGLTEAALLSPNLPIVASGSADGCPIDNVSTRLPGRESDRL